MNNNGKGGNNRRRPFRRRDRDNENWSREGKKKADPPRYDVDQGVIYERLKWIPPRTSKEPIPSPNCPCCGKPIKDIAAALTDKSTGQPAHFDCVVAKIEQHESLENGEVIAYLGGGRFGVVRFNHSQNSRNFSIKKILEWEDKENRAEWRKTIADHYSIT
ncbi:MAG: hypothetical protein LBG08_08825 [Spirochaetaceae bacterium]|jgi:hypothetical protein|nr:hypothetical protein [Spirochaetaceae bacterium]